MRAGEQRHIAGPAAGAGGSLSPGPSHFPVCHLAICGPSCLTNARHQHEETASAAPPLLPLAPPAVLTRPAFLQSFIYQQKPGVKSSCPSEQQTARLWGKSHVGGCQSEAFVRVKPADRGISSPQPCQTSCPCGPGSDTSISLPTGHGTGQDPMPPPLIPPLATGAHTGAAPAQG